jgi:hypothetical protein
MTQKELYKQATEIILDETRDQKIIDRVRSRTLALINKHVSEVIGEDARNTPRTERDSLVKMTINNVKAELRQRAGLDKEASENR